MNQRGFTLLELMVALALFGLVSAMAYGGLQSVLETRERVRAEGERLAGIQLAFNVLDRDLEQIVARDWRDSWGEQHPPITLDRLAVEPRLELVTAAGRLGEQRSSLRRIGYELEDGILYRLIWGHVDGLEEAPGARSRLMGDTDDPRRRIERLAFEFHYRPAADAVNRDGEGVQVADGWPPEGRHGRDVNLLALSIELEMANGVLLQRLYPIGG